MSDIISVISANASDYVAALLVLGLALVAIDALRDIGLDLVRRIEHHDNGDNHP